jgi:hypothetical protein
MLGLQKVMAAPILSEQWKGFLSNSLLKFLFGQINFFFNI